MTTVENPRKVGRRLEDVTESVLERIKKLDIFEDYRRFRNKGVPDFMVDEEIGIECKNWDPEKKNIINETNVKRKILPKYRRHNWRKKVLIIPKLRFYEKR
jgi:hypothetical protein